MKRLLFLVLISLLPISLMAQNIAREMYIRQYYKLAIREMQSYGIPASITMAQGLLESGNGLTFLATEANNHFGIKCHDWPGPYVQKDDDEKNECFRKYIDPIQSFEDHSIFLSTRDRYAFLFDLKATDYKGWARGLKKAGYATDPHYPDKLIKIIEDNELFLLDEYALAHHSENKRLPYGIDPEDDITLAEIKTEVEEAAVDTLIASTPIIPINKKVLTSANGIHYIIVQDEKNIAQIARNHNLHEWEVYKYNDLTDRHLKNLDVGQRIYVEGKLRKARKGPTEHTVMSGETMYEISQEHGIKLKSLYFLNRMDRGTQPRIGQVISLKKRVEKK